jgi:ATP-binding cassette subfamily B (MDR/TAP) protein 1
MRKGSVIEEGSHAELMRQGTVYFDMVHQQGADETANEDAPEEPPIRMVSNENALLEKLPLDIEDKHTRATTLVQDPRERSSIWNLAVFVHSLNPKDGLLVLSGLAFSLIAGASHPV